MTAMVPSHLEGGDGDVAAERVAPEGGAVLAGLDGEHHLVVGQHSGDGASPQGRVNDTNKMGPCALFTSPLKQRNSEKSDPGLARVGASGECLPEHHHVGLDVVAIRHVPWVPIERLAVGARAWPQWVQSRRPVRDSPVWTSSAMSRHLYCSHRALTWGGGKEALRVKNWPSDQNLA